MSLTFTFNNSEVRKKQNKKRNGSCVLRLSDPLQRERLCRLKKPGQLPLSTFGNKGGLLCLGLQTYQLVSPAKSLGRRINDRNRYSSARYQLAPTGKGNVQGTCRSNRYFLLRLSHLFEQYENMVAVICAFEARTKSNH